MGDDWVQIIIDPFQHRQRGFLFAVNPLGIQADALWTEGSESPDYSYDVVWSSEGRLAAGGYVAMMAIPFRSLRFRPDVPTRALRSNAISPV